MIDRDHKDTMPRNSEASVVCLKNNGYLDNSNGKVNTVDEPAEHKDEKNIHPATPVVSTMTQRNLPIMRDCVYPNEGYNCPAYWQDFYMWPAFYPNHHQMQPSPWNATENLFHPNAHEYAYAGEHRIQCMPFRMTSPGLQHDYQFQEFQYFVVMDFEATCDKERPIHPQEIIEFPSVLVNSVTGQLEASFQTYVRPAYHQHLTDFCKELTGIQQIQVDRGVSLSEALIMHDKWLEEKGIKDTKFAIVTWGDWDCRVMLESECKFKRIRKPTYFNWWINLKIPYKEVFGVRCNLRDAVQIAGLSWEGRPHSGLDDARNTARILALIMRRGFRFSITNSLMRQSADRPAASTAFTNHTPNLNIQAEKMQQLLGPSNSSQLYPSIDPAKQTHCYCGAMSSKCMARQRGPNYGRYFFGCGNWTPTRGAQCTFFKWA